MIVQIRCNNVVFAGHNVWNSTRPGDKETITVICTGIILIHIDISLIRIDGNSSFSWILYQQRSSRPLASSSERTKSCSSFPYFSLQSYRTEVVRNRSSCNYLCYMDSSTTVFVIILVTKSPTETHDSSTA